MTKFLDSFGVTYLYKKIKAYINIVVDSFNIKQNELQKQINTLTELVLALNKTIILAQRQFNNGTFSYPLENEFSFAIHTIVASIDISSCISEPDRAETILMIGQTPNRWEGYNIHIYYDAYNKRIISNAVANGYPNGISLYTPYEGGGVISVKISYDGIYINGQKTLGIEDYWFNHVRTALDKPDAVKGIYLGTGSSANNRTNAMYNYIALINNDVNISNDINN